MSLKHYDLILSAALMRSEFNYNTLKHAKKN